MIGGDGAGTLVALGTVVTEEQVSAGAESSVVAVAATTAALTRLGVNIPRGIVLSWCGGSEPLRKGRCSLSRTKTSWASGGTSWDFARLMSGRCSRQ